MSKPCDYCVMQWKPLFRIHETYVLENFCVESGLTCEHEACKEFDCHQYNPQYNCLNITVAISGYKLMFEDKHGEGKTDDWKRFVEIKFCPMCGRELA